jgi:DNA replication and repair protein RecF
MYLKELKIANFRNCKEIDIAFSPSINCFVGKNGAGKTNLLDAVYYLSFCKSYFGNLEQQNITHNADFFSILGAYQRGEHVESCHCVLERGKPKQFKLNKKEYDRLADHIGRYPLVMVSPYDTDLINAGSDERRRYVDSVVSQFNRNYLDDLITYNKALTQRNALLKQFAETGYFDRNMLEIWDMRMELPAHRIFEIRKTFAESFSPVFQKFYSMVSNAAETVEMAYESTLYETSFRELMQQSLERDRMLRYSAAGIHKDNLIFKINGFPVKYFGSQGQQKSFLVAMKLAQFDYIREKTGIKPILLLDDVFDKLDDERVKQLVQLTGSDYFGQVFITDTQQARIKQIFKGHSVDHRIFQVEDGEISNTIKPQSKG